MGQERATITVVKALQLWYLSPWLGNEYWSRGLETRSCWRWREAARIKS